MRILLVEDEMFLAQTIVKKFSNKNISIVHEYDGKKALDLILYDNFDIIILDIMLPSLSGIEIIKEVRKEKNNIPIILTSAKGEVEDKVLGLEVGADDYLVKPYNFEELLARIKTNLRRAENIITIENLSIKNLSFQRDTLIIFTENKEMKLTLKEFDLLEYLVKSHPNTISKEQIIVKIWGNESDILANQVEVYISYLRKKLKLINANIKIKTIYGIGYTIEEIDV